MSTFSDQLDDDIDNMFLADGEFAIPGIYVDIDSNSYTIYGIFDDSYVLSQPGSEVGVQSVGPVFKCKLSDIESVSSSVRKGDKILINGINYSIQDSQPDGVGLTILTLKYP